MKRRFPVWAISVCAAMLISTARAQDVPDFSNAQASMQAAVVNREAPSIAAAAVDDGRVVWLHAEGWADVEARLPATPDTIYRIGSVSKSITATVAVSAAKARLINLSRATCLKIIGQSPADPMQCRISPAHMLNMAAGMPQAVHYPGLGDEDPRFDANAFVSRYAFSVTGPGDRYDYSNMGPAMVARAIEDSARVPFAAYAKRVLLAPLGMTATFYTMREAPPAVRATSYSRSLSRFERAYETEPVASAGMVSSVRDLAKFALLHLGAGGAGLSAHDIATMHQPQTAGVYGFGWGHIAHAGGTLLISDGQVNGGQAVILLDPAANAGAIIAANAASDRVYEIALATLESRRPGATTVFERGVADAEANLAKRLASLTPDRLDWSGEGLLFVDGRAVPIRISVRGGNLEASTKAGVVRGTSLDTQNGYLRWSIPCLPELPMCVAGAEATLALTKGARGLDGTITVEAGRGGLYPYGLHLE